MIDTQLIRRGLPAMVLAVIALPAGAQSFRVQCPTSTITHPVAANNNSEPVYVAPTTQAIGANGYMVPTPSTVNGAIKCQQISGGDGYATMADGTQTYMFSFGPLSGIASMANGLPGTQFPSVFNTLYSGVPLQPGDPATTDSPDPTVLPAPLTSPAFTYDGAIGQVYDADVGATVIDGHVDPRQIMDVGVMNGNIPAPLMAIDEDDEFFLTLTNVGMIMRPDLFEQHTDPLPRLSERLVVLRRRARRIGRHQHRRQLHLLLPGAGRRHLLLALPHHAARAPADGHGRADLRAAAAEPCGGGQHRCYTALSDSSKSDLRTACNSASDILCSNADCRRSTPRDASDDSGSGKPATGRTTPTTTATARPYYDVEYPLQIHGFDPNFHFVGMTFNPEGFRRHEGQVLPAERPQLSRHGRRPGPCATAVDRRRDHFSQPLPIDHQHSGRAARRCCASRTST